MKTSLKHFGALAVLFSAMAAHAQYQDRAKVNVPFPFNAAGKTLPAGEYRVKFDETARLVTLAGENGTVALLSSYADAQTDPRTFLQFKRVGGQWFLQQVAIEGTSEHMQDQSGKKATIESVAMKNSVQNSGGGQN